MLIGTKEQYEARRPHHWWGVTPRRKKPASYGVFTQKVGFAGAVRSAEDIMNKAAVTEFFFGSSPPSLRMDLIRIGVWAVMFVVLGALWWHDYGFLWSIPIWLAVTLGTHLYWHYRPTRRPGPPPVTRYTNPRYTKH